MKVKEYKSDYQKPYNDKHNKLRSLNLRLQRLKEMDVDNTEWRDLYGYEGKFIINKNGEIRNSDTYRKKVIRKDRLGYLCCTFDGKTRLHHRLLALTFIHNPDPENFKEINHKNGIKDDNRLENLEWTSRSLNMIHYFKMNGKSNLLNWHEKRKQKNEKLRGN